MKHSAILAGLFFVLAAPAMHAAALPAPLTPTERMDLFNGRDFAGWTFCLRSNAPPADTFTASAGLMHCTGQPFSYARTDKSFRDCKLTVECRFVKSYVNGRLMNQVAGCTVPSGAIAVQSEGGEWELRKIYVEPLP